MLNKFILGTVKAALFSVSQNFIKCISKKIRPVKVVLKTCHIKNSPASLCQQSCSMDNAW